VSGLTISILKLYSSTHIYNASYSFDISGISDSLTKEESVDILNEVAKENKVNIFTYFVDSGNKVKNIYSYIGNNDEFSKNINSHKYDSFSPEISSAFHEDKSEKLRRSILGIYNVDAPDFQSVSNVVSSLKAKGFETQGIVKNNESLVFYTVRTIVSNNFSILVVVMFLGLFISTCYFVSSRSKEKFILLSTGISHFSCFSIFLFRQIKYFLIAFLAVFSASAIFLGIYNHFTLFTSYASLFLIFTLIFCTFVVVSNLLSELFTSTSLLDVKFLKGKTKNTFLFIISVFSSFLILILCSTGLILNFEDITLAGRNMSVLGQYDKVKDYSTITLSTATLEDNSSEKIADFMMSEDKQGNLLLCAKNDFSVIPAGLQPGFGDKTSDDIYNNMVINNAFLEHSTLEDSAGNAIKQLPDDNALYILIPTAKIHYEQILREDMQDWLKNRTTVNNIKFIEIADNQHIVNYNRGDSVNLVENGTISLQAVDSIFFVLPYSYKFFTSSPVYFANYASSGALYLNQDDSLLKRQVDAGVSKYINTVSPVVDSVNRKIADQIQKIYTLIFSLTLALVLLFFTVYICAKLYVDNYSKKLFIKFTDGYNIIQRHLIYSLLGAATSICVVIFEAKYFDQEAKNVQASIIASVVFISVYLLFNWCCMSQLEQKNIRRFQYALK
jgi:hypothetical protein